MQTRRTALIALLMGLILVLGGAMAVSARGWRSGDTQAVTAGQSDCADQDQAGSPDANEAEDGRGDATDSDAVEAECGDQQDNDEAAVAAGAIDDGKELLPQAQISLEQAVAAARAAASGDIGEIDLEYYHDQLVFNVDVGDHDVKVSATDGTVLGQDSDD